MTNNLTKLLAVCLLGSAATSALPATTPVSMIINNMTGVALNADKCRYATGNPAQHYSILKASQLLPLANIVNTQKKLFPLFSSWNGEKVCEITNLVKLPTDINTKSYVYTLSGDGVSVPYTVDAQPGGFLDDTKNTTVPNTCFVYTPKVVDTKSAVSADYKFTGRNSVVFTNVCNISMPIKPRLLIKSDPSNDITTLLNTGTYLNTIDWHTWGDVSSPNTYITKPTDPGKPYIPSVDLKYPTLNYDTYVPDVQNGSTFGITFRQLDDTSTLFTNLQTKYGENALAYPEVRPAALQSVAFYPDGVSGIVTNYSSAKAVLSDGTNNFFVPMVLGANSTYPEQVAVAPTVLDPTKTITLTAPPLQTDAVDSKQNPKWFTSNAMITLKPYTQTSDTASNIVKVPYTAIFADSTITAHVNVKMPADYPGLKSINVPISFNSTFQNTSAAADVEATSPVDISAPHLLPKTTFTVTAGDVYVNNQTSGKFYTFSAASKTQQVTTVKTTTKAVSFTYAATETAGTKQGFTVSFPAGVDAAEFKKQASIVFTDTTNADMPAIIVSLDADQVTASNSTLTGSVFLLNTDKYIMTLVKSAGSQPPAPPVPGKDFTFKINVAGDDATTSISCDDFNGCANAQLSPQAVLTVADAGDNKVCFQNHQGSYTVSAQDPQTISFGASLCSGAIKASSKSASDVLGGSAWKIFDLNGAVYTADSALEFSPSTGVPQNVALVKFHTVFAPYLDPTMMMTQSSSPTNKDWQTSLADANAATPTGSELKAGSPTDIAFTQAFITSQGQCTATLANMDPSTTKAGIDQTNLKHYISFGGASGTMLAESCQTPDALEAQYEAVYKTYSGPNLLGFDFDIEGGAPTNATLLKNFPLAIKAFHKKHPNVEIWLTLATMPEGLTDAKTTVQAVVDAGAPITGIDLMAMDYGRQDQEMGTGAIDSGNALHTYLKGLYPNYSEAQLWSMVAITPMIGKNDNGNLPFSLADARALNNKAQSLAANGTPYGGIRFWSLDRDNNPTGSSSGGPTHSGIAQNTWDFTAILRQASDY